MSEATQQPVKSGPPTRKGWRSWNHLLMLRAPLLVLTAETVLSAAFILYFCRTYKISKSLIAIHLPLAIALFALSISLPGLFLYSRKIRESKFSRYLLSLIPGLTFATMGILYATDFASYLWTGYNINYKLLNLFISDWRHGGELISLSHSIYAAVIVFVFTVLAIHLGIARTVFAGLENLLLPGRPVSLFKDRRRAIRSCVVIALLSLGYFFDVYTSVRRAPYSELLSSDPLLSFVRSTTEVYDPNYPAYEEKLRAEERQCRFGYAQGQKFEKKNVIIIVVDALRADHTQVYGYSRATTPFLERLLEQGQLHKVELATSTCSGTYCGVISTLASKPLKRLIPGDFKLPDLLHDQGYKTYFLLSGSHDWQGLKEAYGQEMTLYFDAANSKKYASTDDRLIFEGLDLVPNYGAAPAFFYIHLMAVHLIGVKQESFNLYQPVAERNDFQAMFRGESGHWPMIINSYDNSVMQADATIKDIFAALDSKGYLKNSIVVILADHGEGLGERSRYGWGHGHWLYQEFIRIPLLIYDESTFKYANLKFATQIDVAPTIVDRLGLAIPGCWQGASLLDPNIRTVTTHQTSLSKPCYAVLYRTDAAMYKYMYCSAGQKEELYNLTDDPKEQNNLIETADPSLLQFMRAELQRTRSD
jgi:glucan phosphoethanolaminetransferase (alkaline phosphatase superfamily)